MQVRHAAEDQVSAARQEAQRAIRDLQAAASRLQVRSVMFSLALTSQCCSVLHTDPCQQQAELC